MTAGKLAEGVREGVDATRAMNCLRPSASLLTLTTVRGVHVHLLCILFLRASVRPVCACVRAQPTNASIGGGCVRACQRGGAFSRTTWCGCAGPPG